MAAVIKKVRYIGNRLHVRDLAVVTGTGAIVNGDDLATDLRKFPIGSQYIQNGSLSIRTQDAGVAADWIVLSPAV